jgi:hypothetical protein
VRDPEAKYPLGRSSDQLASLRQLRSNPLWQQWESVLEELHKQESSRLVGGLKHDEYLVVTGRVQSLETVYSLIETLDRQAREIDEHSSKRRDAERDTNASIAARRDLAFSGSNWWNIANGK